MARTVDDFSDPTIDLDELDDLRALVRVRSNGQVQSPDLYGRWAKTSGLFAPSLFGEPDGFGHVVVDRVIHPAAIPPLADALGVGADDLRAVLAMRAWFEGARIVREPEGDMFGQSGATAYDHSDATAFAGVLARATELGGRAADILRRGELDLVPVPPLRMRPMIERLSPTMIDPWAGPVNEAWAALIAATYRRARLHELAARSMILVHEDVRVQRALDHALAVTREPPAPRAWQLGPPTATPPALVSAPNLTPEHDDAIVGLLFLGPHRLLVQTAADTLVVSLSGAIERTFPPWGAIATDVHGDRVRMTNWIGAPWDWHDAVYGLLDPEDTLAIGVLDLASGAYLDSYPADLPRLAFHNGEPEDLVARDLFSATSFPVRWGGDRPGVLAVSRDFAFACVGDTDDGAIIDVATGVPLVHLPSARPEASRILGLELAPFGYAEGLLDELEQAEAGCAAIAVTADQRWRILEPSGVVGDGREAWFRLGCLLTAAAFDPAGERLAFAVGREVRVISLGPSPEVVAGFALPER